MKDHFTPESVESQIISITSSLRKSKLKPEQAAAAYTMIATSR